FHGLGCIARTRRDLDRDGTLEHPREDRARLAERRLRAQEQNEHYQPRDVIHCGAPLSAWTYRGACVFRNVKLVFPPKRLAALTSSRDETGPCNECEARRRALHASS